MKHPVTSGSLLSTGGNKNSCYPYLYVSWISYKN